MELRGDQLLVGLVEQVRVAARDYLDVLAYPLDDHLVQGQMFHGECVPQEA